MSAEDQKFPFYEGINEFLKSVSKTIRTKNPLFFCLPIQGKIDKVRYKPPFRKGFYSLLLVTNASKYTIYSNSDQIGKFNHFLVIQPPGQLFSYKYEVGMHTKGYMILFKPEVFSFLKEGFGQDFYFLDSINKNVFEIPDSKMKEIESYFEEVFESYNNPNKVSGKIAPLKLLILLYVIKEYVKQNEKDSQTKVAEGQGAEILFQNFLQLVNTNYLEKRTIKEYAYLLKVSPNYLSLIIKQHSNQSALSFVNKRMASEAKSFLLHTDFTISEIASKLNFSDVSNFVKFFKKQTGKTPVEFKKENKNMLAVEMDE